MQKLLTLAAASAIALGIGISPSIANANNAQAKIDFCHYSGHTADDDMPLIYPKGDHFIASNGFTHTAAACRNRGGKVIKIGCPAIKGHVPAARHDLVDQFCDLVR